MANDETYPFTAASAAQKQSQPPQSTIGFQSCTEQPKETDLQVEGQLPAWLSGLLYRTGPGQYEVGQGAQEEDGDNKKKSFSIQHWFDGKALNHRFHIDGQANKVAYRSRLACSEELQIEKNLGRTSGVTFAQSHDPCERFFTKFQLAFHALQGGKRDGGASNANVGVTLDFDHREKSIVARTDANRLQRLDATTLEPMEAFTYGAMHSDLAQGALTAAHPARASDNDVRYNYVIIFGPFPKYKVFATDANGKTTILTTIYDAPSAYLHSLAVTDDYVVLTIWQADITASGLSIPYNNNVLQGIAKWNSSRQTLFYLIDRKTGKVCKRLQWKKPFFCFHHINAFQRRQNEKDSSDKKNNQEEIVLDLVTYADTSILYAFAMDNLRSFDVERMPKSSYERIILSFNPNDKKKHKGTITSTPTKIDIELPTINPMKRWKEARFAYGIHHTRVQASRHLFVDAVIKLDMMIKNEVDSSQPQIRLWTEPGKVPGEPIFVQRPGATQEDDGVLLTVVLDAFTQQSELICL